VTTAAAITEFPATERFSARMDSGLYDDAGEAIAALSLDAVVSASPFAVRRMDSSVNIQICSVQMIFAGPGEAGKICYDFINTFILLEEIHVVSHLWFDLAVSDGLGANE
jgi:hypothetical protein